MHHNDHVQGLRSSPAYNFLLCLAGREVEVNKFGMVVAVLQLFACTEAVISKDWNRAMIYAGFAVGSAGVALA